MAELRGCRIGPDTFKVARQVGLAGDPTARPFGEVALLQVILKGQLVVLQHLRTWVRPPTPTADLVAVPQGEQEFAQYVAALCQRIRTGLEDPHGFKRIIYAFMFR